MIPAPDAPWIECTIADINDGGVCLGSVTSQCQNCSGWPSLPAARCCLLVWRRGELVGARYVTARELRHGLVPAGKSDRDIMVG